MTRWSLIKASVPTVKFSRRLIGRTGGRDGVTRSSNKLTQLRLTCFSISNNKPMQLKLVHCSNSNNSTQHRLKHFNTFHSEDLTVAVMVGEGSQKPAGCMKRCVNCNASTRKSLRS